MTVSTCRNQRADRNKTVGNCKYNQSKDEKQYILEALDAEHLHT